MRRSIWRTARLDSRPHSKEPDRKSNYHLTSDVYPQAAYSNYVMAYIPSLRVLQEGGYEGGGAMTFYGRLGVWGQPWRRSSSKKSMTWRSL